MFKVVWLTRYVTILFLQHWLDFYIVFEVSGSDFFFYIAFVNNVNYKR